MHEQSSFSNLSVTSPTSQLILQPFRRFTYVTPYSPTLPLLHLLHSSFSNPSFAAPKSQALHLRHLASRPCLQPVIAKFFGYNIRNVRASIVMENEVAEPRATEVGSCSFSCEVFGPEALEHACANHDTEGKRFKSPIHCCNVTKPPYLFSGELCTSHLHCKLLFVYTVCCRRTGQCFSVLRTRKSDVIVT